MGAVPLVSDVAAVVGTGIIFKFHRVHWEVAFAQVGHDCANSSKMVMVVVFGGKGLHQHGVGHVEVGQHNVLVATLCTDREMLSVIRVESTELEFAEVDFWHWGAFPICRFVFWLWLHGEDMLIGLVVFSCKHIGESRP